MAIKIEKINEALVITETTAPAKVLVDTPARLVYYDVAKLEENAVIRLFNINEREFAHQKFADYAIGIATTDGSTLFTDATWKTFARTELGNQL